MIEPDAPLTNGVTVMPLLSEYSIHSDGNAQIPAWACVAIVVASSTSASTTNPGPISLFICYLPPYVVSAKSACRLFRIDRTVDVRCRSLRDVRQHFAGGGIDGVEHLRAIDPLAVNQQPAGRDFQLLSS